jgi:hypothetical protein
MAEQSDSNSVQAQPAVLHATIHVTRAATGKVETFQLVGTPAEVTGTAGRISAADKQKEAK